MNYLNSNELNTVYGGAVLDTIASLSAAAGLGTMKKMSMIACVGKELKHGIQEFDLQSLARASFCVFLTSFGREAISMKVKPSKAKSN